MSWYRDDVGKVDDVVVVVSPSDGHIPESMFGRHNELLSKLVLTAVGPQSFAEGIPAGKLEHTLEMLVQKTTGRHDLSREQKGAIRQMRVIPMGLWPLQREMKGAEEIDRPPCNCPGGRTVAHWSCDTPTPKHMSLAEVAGGPKRVLLYHGTTRKSMNSILTEGVRLDVNVLKIEKMKGFLGPGFYATLSPEEAVGYSCLASKRCNSDHPDSESTCDAFVLVFAVQRSVHSLMLASHHRVQSNALKLFPAVYLILLDDAIWCGLFQARQHGGVQSHTGGAGGTERKESLRHPLPRLPKRSSEETGTQGQHLLPQRGRAQSDMHHRQRQQSRYIEFV